MARRFMRIDLSDEARDFRPIAVEPGVPMLDKSDSNAKILFRWLGRLVAEPVWEGESVSFYVRDDHGGRLEEAVCQPATAEDLENMLQGDLATLKDRIEKAKPETPTERAIKKTLRRSFEELTEDPNRTDLDCYFFRYRDVHGHWRLVWCWGYQRVDREPAPAVICTDPECNLLFVRRPGQSPKCPCCEAALASRPIRRTHWKRTALVGLLLFLLGAGLVYWWLHPQRLIATPDMYAGPVGSRVQFKVEKAGLFWFWKEDVTSQTVGVVLDPAVARFDQMASAATFTGPGETYVRFYLGELNTEVALIGRLLKNPDNIAIEPRDVELAIGTTARLKLTGEYKDGTKVDLSDAAEWTAQNDGIVYAYGGLLEGLAEGKTAVTARYRADPDSDYLDASANVSVAKVKFKKLELAIEPLPVGVGRASELRIDAVSEEGKKYSVLESSLLSTEVTPGYVASVERSRLKGRHVGTGKLAVTFDDSLAAGQQFDVVLQPGLDKLVVRPEKLKMAVGEITDLNVLSPSSATIKMASSDPAVVEITGANRLIGRAEGKAQVAVTQAGQEAPKPVQVTVVAAEFRSIAVDPARLVVPVDDTLGVRVLARIKGDKSARDVEIAPDLLLCQQRPSPLYADFDARLLKLHGVTPTVASSPQRLAFRFQQHQASAPVEVVVAPLRLVLTPSGPVDLPLGQQMRLQGWANYSGGRRVQVLPHRLKFDSQLASGAAPGLELRGDKVAALKPKAGPLSVFAGYFGRKSKPVVFNSVAADPAVTLRLEVDRTLRLAGETGRVVLSATGPKGDVELVPDLATFKSSGPEVLKIDAKTGAFRAIAPGEAIITGSHDGAKNRASLKLRVFDPAKARLVFEPSSVHVAVDEVARLQLYLEVEEGGKLERARLAGPGVGYAMTQPQAIRWSPPTLVGISPAPPFELSASYFPYLSSIATATVEVVDAVKPETIRIVPSSATLAPGQTLALKLEQQLPGAPKQWKEVRPDAVAWTVPPGLVWAPATDALRPALTVPEGARDQFELRARYNGKEAVGLIKLKEKGPDPNDPTAQVLLLREPEGEYLPVGAHQRYSIVVKKDGLREPAAQIKWPGDFENEYVRWQAPVLNAKKAGYRQWLRAEVDGRTVLFHTSTYQPGRFDRPPPREDQPAAVVILSDQGPTVQFPVGAEFDDFRVEARYADGFTRLVTKKAILRTPEPPESAPLSAAGGRLTGVRPGQTTVHAEFDGVATEQPLGVTVLGQLDIDQIRIAPAPLNLQPGETIAVDVVGYKNNRSVGIITGLGNIIWNSDNPQVARVDGSSVTGVAVGQGSLTAQLGSITSAPAQVNVVQSIADPLVIDPQLIRIRVGEGVRIGTDLSVMRGDMDLSRQCTVTPALPGVVQYVPETHSLVGKAPGASAVAFTFGDKLSNAMVEVLPAGGAIDGEVLIEPAGGNLAPGQALDLRVFVVSPAGERIDRTDSAVLSSSDPASVTVQANRACAVAPGAAEITATVPGTEQTGKAHVTVSDEEITELIVEPPQIAMSTGDIRRLQILGRAPSGTRELFPQPDLTVTAGGPSPDAIQIVGGRDIDAVRSGQASVVVNWQNRLSREVDVTVNDDPLHDLQIEPAEAVIHPGQPLVYQVTGMRGGERRVLGPEDGVKLFVGQEDVAQVAENALAVRGNTPGRTTVLAKVGGEQAQALLEVTPGDGPPAGEVLAEGPGGVHSYGPGAGYWGGPGGWHGGWGGWDGWTGDGGYADWHDGGYHDVFVPPAAEVASLRFIPDVLRLDPNSPPTGVRVVEVLANGADGRDVTADPNLEVGPSSDVVTVEKTATGPLLRPVGVGQTRLGAKLGLLTADPLLVAVGDFTVGPGRLVVAPDPLLVWSGETGSFGTVMLDCGGGQPLRQIDYKVTPAPNQAVVTSAGDQTIRGLSPGTTQVVVTAVDPTGVYDGLSTTATVQVVSADRLWIEPAAISLQIGQPTPPLKVMAGGQDGLPYRVPAAVQSMDPNVLVPDPEVAGRFMARALGGTEIRATYRGKEAFASVNVAGQRFVQVIEELDRGTEDFGVILRVLADKSENPLEYRVYVAGQPPEGSPWIRAVGRQDGSQLVELHSPRMRYGPPNSLYNLIIEARDSPDEPPQRYPFTFRLRPEIERADNLPPGGRTDTP